MHPQIPASDAFELLRRVPVFSELEPDALNELAREVQTCRHRARQVVIQEGDAAEAIFAVSKGHLKVTSSREDRQDTLFGVLGPGDVFGELGILDGSPRSASVTTLEPTELLSVPREPFLKLVSQRPGFAVRLLGVLTRRVRALSEDREQLNSLEVPARLAKTLADLGQRFGKAEHGGILIEVKLSQQELGELIGATRESVNKHLREWSKLGLLRQESGRLWLRSCDELRQLTASAPK